MTLREVREAIGNGITIFGNIELNMIEFLGEKQFRDLVQTSLREGPANGSRFLLMPTAAAPLGRELSPVTVRNYRIMADECKNYTGKG